MKTIALLVGINDYTLKPLRGCVNDVNSVEKFLLDFYKSDDLKIKKLLNSEATRQGLIDAFAWFNQAKDGDTCLLYYSGHGSYMTAASEFWTETDGNLETLVCYDSRTANGRDLANKELGFLIWQYSYSKKVNFVVITDSCHSGSVTRDLLDSNTWLTDRTAPTKSGSTPVEDFHGFGLLLDGQSGYIDTTEEGVRKVSIKIAPHIHLAASRNNQTAKEDEIQGEHRGIFTYSLLRTLIAGNGKINYQNLIASTSAKVKTMVGEQDPSLNVIGFDNTARSRIFLNSGQLKDGERIYKVFHDSGLGWIINGGGINDFKAGDKVDMTGGGSALISEVKVDTASLEVPEDLDPGKQYDAKVNKSKRIAVSFEWSDGWESDWETGGAIRQLASTATDFFIPEDGGGTFFIRKQDGKLFLSPKNSKWALFKKIERHANNAIEDLVANIDKVCRWYLLRDLENPASSINEENVHIKVEEIGNEHTVASEDGYFFYYKLTDGKWKAPKIRISLKNTSSSLGRLEVKPLYLGFDYGVDATNLNQITLDGESQNLTLTKGDRTVSEIILTLDTKYRELGYNQITEYLKVFVSTKQIETQGFGQEGIELDPNVAEKDLQDKEAEVRGLSIDPDEDETVDDWQAFTIKLTVTRPAEAEVVPEKEFKAFGLRFTNNSQLIASMGFSTATEIGQRAIQGVETATPLNEVKGNDVFRPAELVPNHGQGQSLNVIEIFDPKNPESVSDETPLVLTSEAAIDPNETIIPFGFDPETQTYFPLGRSNSDGSIVINTLPPETPSDALITKRSLGGSLKIYFYKIVGQRIGLKYDYPQLSIARVDENEKLTYEKDAEEIAAAVKNAQKIILFIHGIIGDTEEMVKAVRRTRAKNGKLLVDKFDLVLAFDYENLNTKIQETAGDLKKRLTAVGLGEGHQKELVIIAHSMGGLVSRYFIEKIGGSKMVSHLVMLGTPNGGSEWADVRDMAEVLLTSAVNGIAAVKPWLIPLSFVGKLFSGTQITLQQMNNEGELSIMPELNDGTDAKVKYTIIAGNTQLIGTYAKMEGGLLKRITARLKEKPHYAALDLFIFKEANDIAVRVKNIGTIAGLTPVIYEVPSDHISYFGVKESLEKLGGLF